MLVGAVVMTFVIIAGVALLSQRSDTITPREVSSKQYTVKKSRDSARGLASSDRNIDRDPGEAPATEPVESLTPDAESKTTRVQVPVKTDTPLQSNVEQAAVESSVASIIAESYTVDGTEAAMDVLARALADAQAPDDTSKLYAAIGALQLAQAEPDKDGGLAALRNATEAAETPAVRSEAAVTEASALMVHAKSADGLTRINELLDDDRLEGEAKHHLMLLRGDLLVEQGDVHAAEATYEQVRKAVSPEGLRSDDPVGPLFRQASLRLARLYARTGDEKKEDIIARDLKRLTKPRT